MTRWSRASAELARNALILTDAAKFEFCPSQSICDNQSNYKSSHPEYSDIKHLSLVGVNSIRKSICTTKSLCIRILCWIIANSIKTS